jgi:hypothetical protein
MGGNREYWNRATKEDKARTGLNTEQEDGSYVDTRWREVDYETDTRK